MNLLLVFQLFSNSSFLPFLSRKLMEQIQVQEQAISHQSGEREELIGHLNQIKEDHTSANQNTESMVGKIQVRFVRRGCDSVNNNSSVFLDGIKMSHIHTMCLISHLSVTSIASPRLWREK